MMSRCSLSSSNGTDFFQTLNGIRQLTETRRFKAWFLDQFGLLILNRRNDSWFASLGRSCIHMTWSDRGAISLEGLGLDVVENVEDAEFILAHGTEALGLSSGGSLPLKSEELEKILEKCAAKGGIPMVVANPDFVTVEARALRVMPGTLAAKYERLGGKVKWMGKPDKRIYDSAMEMAGVDNASDCIEVGDSPHHDIKGAMASGIESVFISGGIHTDELGLTSYNQKVSDPSSVKALAEKFDVSPSYVLPSFIWRTLTNKIRFTHSIISLIFMTVDENQNWNTMFVCRI